MQFFKHTVKNLGSHLGIKGSVHLRAGQGVLLIVLVVVCFQNVAASHSTFDGVIFSGVKHVNEGALHRAVDWPLSSRQLQVALRKWGRVYYDLGYFDAVLKPDTTHGETLRVEVSEGSPISIHSLFVRGNKVLSDEHVLDLLALKGDSRFTSRIVEKGMEALLAEYAMRGYLYATAVLERFEVTPDGVILGIAISEGVSVRLAELKIEGNRHTQSHVVRRFARLKIGETLNLQQVSQASKLLRRSGLFSSIEEAILFRAARTGDKIGVLLRVNEIAKRNTIFGVFGLAQDPRTQEPYVNGAIDLKLSNIFGTGRDVGVAWKQDAITGSNLRLDFRERFLFGWPLDLRLNIASTVRDSSFTWQSVGIRLELPLNNNLSVEVGSHLDRSVFHTSLQGNTRRVRNQLGLLFRSLSREEDGRRFGSIQIQSEYARKTNRLTQAGNEDRRKVRQTLWSGRIDAGIPVRRHQVLGIRGEWHVIESNESEVSQSELYYFGGAKTLRGFREEQFRGDQVAFGSLEYRIGDPRAARLYGFFDLGALRLKKGDGVITKNVHSGFGLGLRGQVPTGVFDLSFGMGEERSFAGMKVHVSLLQRF